MLLVVGAGLFVRTLVNLTETDPGFRPQHVLLFHIQPPLSRYPRAKSIALDHQIEEKLATIPGVASVGLSTLPLLANNVSDTDFVPDGQADSGKDDKHEAEVDLNLVGDGASSRRWEFPLVSGRDFNDRDTETSPRVAIVNRTLARKFFPDSEPDWEDLQEQRQTYPDRRGLRGREVFRPAR